MSRDGAVTTGERIAQGLLMLLLALEVALLVWGPEAAEHRRDIAKALARGTRVDWWDDAALGLRYAAWVNLGVLAVLLATVRGWVFPATKEPEVAQKAGQRPAGGRGFWLGVLLAMGLCVGMKLPLASKSLWWDESWVVMQVTHGRWKEDAKAGGHLNFQAHDWKRAAWYYQKPTNHAPMSLLQKASQNTWRVWTGAPREAFSDLAARVPALAASALGCLWLACLLRAWGRPWAGVSAALLLAVHPWALRYGVDARAYALVMPLSVGALLAVTRILQARGRCLWPWVGFALAEFLWLWAYPQGVYEVLVLNGLLLVLLLPRVERAWRLRMVGRWVAVNGFAALCFIQVFLPNAMQLLRWIGKESVSHPLSVALLKSFGSHLLLGVEHGWSTGIEAQGLPFSGEALWRAWGLLGVAALLFLGARKQFDGLGKMPWALLAVPLVGSGLFLVVATLAEGYFYPRFLISVLPVLLAFVCLGFCVRGGTGWWSHGRWVLGLVLAGLAGPFWLEQWKVSFTRPIAPLHDVARFMQERQAAGGREPLLACFGHGREVMPVYAPRMRLLEKLADLEAVMEEARMKKCPLYVAYGHVHFNQGVFPEGMRVLSDRKKFREAAAFAGLDHEFYFRVVEALEDDVQRN